MAEEEKRLKIIKGKKYYPVKIGKISRMLPLFEVSPGVKIALFNILGDTQVVKAAARALKDKIKVKAEVIVTPEVKSIPLAYELSHLLKIPYVVVRKIVKPYMGDFLAREVKTITTGRPQTLYVDGKDRILLKQKRVLIVDDVVSTGATVSGLKGLMDEAQAQVVGVVAVFTEGEEDKWENVISLGHLPIFRD